MQFYLSYRYIWLLIAAILGLLSYQAGTGLRYDRNVERFFPSDSQKLRDYRELKRLFGGNEIVLAVYEDGGLLAADGSGLARLREIRQRLETISGIRSVLSLDRPLTAFPLLTHQPLAQRIIKLFEGYTHGADGKTVAIVCMLDPRQSAPQPRRMTMNAIREVMSSLPDGLAPGHLTGEPVLVAEGMALVERDGTRLGTWSLALLSLTLAVCFRNARWVVLPVVTVQLSIWYTRAVLTWYGLELSMISSMLTAIVTVVGVATIIHIVVRYELHCRQNLAPRAAFMQTVRELAVPVVWAIVTDAIGFLSLTMSHLGPVQDFGIMMAVGSLIVLFTVPLVAPAVALCCAPDRPAPPQEERRLAQWLSGSIVYINAYRAPLLTATLLVFAVTGFGSLLLVVETDFTRNFRRTSPLVASYELVEEHLGGAGVCDVILPAPTQLNWQYLNRVHHLEQELSRYLDRPDNTVHCGLTKILSLDDALRAVMNLPVDSDVEETLLNNLALRAAAAQMKRSLPTFYHALYAIDGDAAYYRIMLRARERQPAEAKRLLVNNLQRTVHGYYPEARVTGFFVLLADLIASITSDQWTTFGAASVGIATVMALALRDWRLVPIAMAPNILPILSVMGLLGWAHQLGWTSLKLNMGAAMIAAVSLGLSIDSSIHYLIGFRRGMQQYGDATRTLQMAQSNVGQAMILSTIALMVGFSILCTSEFIPTVYFGVLVSLSMLGSLLGNLLLIPLLLSIVYPHDAK